jgi:O-antigen/teichoic acid export membrane protein
MVFVWPLLRNSCRSTLAGFGETVLVGATIVDGLARRHSVVRLALAASFVGVTLLRLLLDRLSRSRFLRRLAILSSGTAIGQATLIIVSPFLTRIYDPEAFGLFAIFGAVAAIFGIVATMRFEYALPRETDDRSAAALVVGIFLTSIIAALLLGCLVWLAGPPFAAAMGAPELGPFLWLLPPSVTLWGMGSALSLWSIRQGTFRLNGLNRVIYHGVQATTQLALGLGGLVGGGLILGYCSGFLARVGHLAVALPQQELRRFFSTKMADSWRMLRHYRRYPMLYALAALLQEACTMLPAILIALLYGPAVAGLYALAQRVVMVPLRFLGESASQAFLGEVRSLDHTALLRLFKRVALLFAGLGMLFIVPLFLAGPWLFAFVFGEAWRETGVFFQLLAPLYLARLVVTPISQTLNILERQDLHLVASALNFLALLVGFTVGGAFELGPRWTIGLFSALSSLSFLFFFIVAWRGLLHSVRRAAAPPT